ncbi:hypothetical protein [Microbacterium sp. 179-I 3D3 NHS]|uniref:hypothetical protein n=1 Tax=unclassified Microbacterium TaxID=2609290 RepID=UPI0039A2C716
MISDAPDYAALGVRRVINASAMQTSLGGSLMPAPVLAAMTEAARSFIDLDELHDRVGESIASLTRNEAACVVNGAAAGVMIATAACLSGGRGDRTSAPRDVVVIDDQRNGYLLGVEAAGAQIVGVRSETDLRATIGDRTACLLLFAGEPWESVAPSLPGLIRAARDAGVPVVVDAADQIPPFASTWRYTRELGATAVVFSGGKGLRGPQSTGLVLGDSALVAECRRLSPPRFGIGRTSKVGKEEMLGILAAVALAADRDEDAERQRLEERARRIAEGLRGIADVVVIESDRSHSGQPVPRVIVTTSSRRMRDLAVAALWEQDPRIAVLDEGDRRISVSPQQIDDGDLDHVIRQLRSSLEDAR